MPSESVISSPMRGRFAPSPTGRMHLGNVYTALMSWLSVKSRGGEWVLRIEDLDPQRSRLEYARQIEDDLLWLGLEWDEGGVDGRGCCGPYLQSRRHEIYDECLRRLKDTSLTYSCCCRRADILATQAPHQSDGRVIYGGTCRPERLSHLGVFASFNDFKHNISAAFHKEMSTERENKLQASVRLYAPDCPIEFTDLVCGKQVMNLARECGDFIVRRSDGAWAYQLAVVADDAMMEITEVMRGNDLLLSSAQQIYIAGLLGFKSPSFAHLPLVCNSEGMRLSKRDRSLSMESLRNMYTPSQLLGLIAHLAGLMPSPDSVGLSELISLFRMPSTSPSAIIRLK